MNRLHSCLALLAFLVTLSLSSPAFGGTCSSPANSIEMENCLPGTPRVSGISVAQAILQGFATDISFNQGQTVAFEIKTNATSYKLDIYRMGQRLR